MSENNNINIEFIKYPKINSLYKRFKKTILPGYYASVIIAGLAMLPIWRITEKYDGFNIRVLFDNETSHLSFKGRGKKKKEAEIDSVLPFLNENISLSLIRKVFNIAEGERSRIVFFGEAIGGRIQRKSQYSEKPHFRMFDIFVYNFDKEMHPFTKGWWLTADNVVDIGIKMGLPTAMIYPELVTLKEVELLAKRRLPSETSELPLTVEGYVAKAEVIVTAEHIAKDDETGIAKNKYQKLFDPKGIPIMVKVKCNDFTKHAQKLEDPKWLSALAIEDMDTYKL